MRVGIFNNTATGGHFGCSAVMSTIETELIARGAEVVFSWPVDFDWRHHETFFKSQAIDLILVNGEGSIHHTSDRKKAMYLTELGKFGRDKLAVPSFLINSTMDGLCDEAAQNLKAFTSIFVREKGTSDYLETLGVTGHVVPDLSIFSPMLKSVADRQAGPLITDSVLKGASHELFSLSEDLGWEHRKMEVVSDAGYFERISHKLRERFGDAEKISRFVRHQKDPEFEAFYQRVSSANALVTGRFHSVMLGLAAKTPVLALQSNTPKIGNVLNDVFGDRRRIVDIEEIKSCRSAADWIGRAGYTGLELEALDKFLLEGRGKSARMFDEIVGGI